MAKIQRVTVPMFNTCFTWHWKYTLNTLLKLDLILKTPSELARIFDSQF